VDYFALLEQPRRPWLDQDALKTKFLAMSASVHPDRLHNASHEEKKAANDSYSQLNSAYGCLRETKDRLAHLLQLELGAKPGDVQKISAAAMDLFMQVGTTIRLVDSFLAEKAKVSSPLIKAQMFEKAMQLTDRLNELQQQINRSRDKVSDELRSMNKAWDSSPQNIVDRSQYLPLARLEEIYRDVSFLNRWTDQIQQRIVQLSL
jgi:DnaJ-domain-containing protein 1